MTASASLSHQIEPGINIGYVKSLLDFLETYGVSCQQVFQWIPELSTELQQDWIKARHLNNLYEHCASYLGNPHIGLQFGHRAGAGSFRMVGFLAVSAPNLLSALNSVLRYQSLYSRIGKMVLRRQEGLLCLCWDAIWPRPLMAAPAVEASIAGWHHLGQHMLGHRIKASHITFKHASRGAQEVYEGTFECPVYFEREYDAIYLKQEYLDSSVPQSDQVVHEALLEKSDCMLAICDNEPVVDKVERVLSTEGRGCILTIEQVAQSLNLPVGELRRQLKKSDLRFRTVCDRTKFLETLNFILQPEVDFADIALQLGFAEQSVFIRAFRRWTNMSPLAYRNCLLRRL